MFSRSSVLRNNNYYSKKRSLASIADRLLFPSLTVKSYQSSPFYALTFNILKLILPLSIPPFEAKPASILFPSSSISLTFARCISNHKRPLSYSLNSISPHGSRSPFRQFHSSCTIKHQKLDTQPPQSKSTDHPVSSPSPSSSAYSPLYNIESSQSSIPTYIPQMRETASAYMPTHSEMIANVHGFWPKLKLRIRLLLMGQQYRPWKVDDVLAVFSWVSFGTTFFILVATTTAVSLLLVAANSIKVQGI